MENKNQVVWPSTLRISQTIRAVSIGEVVDQTGVRVHEEENRESQGPVVPAALEELVQGVAEVQEVGN